MSSSSSTLLSSIFGATFSEKDTEIRLFDDKSKSFPDRPQFEARVGKRSNDDNNNETLETSTPKEQDAKTTREKVTKKRKRKQRTQEIVEEESSASTSTQAKVNEVDEQQSLTDNNNTMEEAKNDVNKNDRTVFVGNLPLETTRKSLAFLFRECGKVESTRLRSVAAAGVKLPPERAGDQNLMRKVCANTSKLDSEAKSTAQGYVVFCSNESVAKALKMNNTKQPNGVNLRVDHATPTMDAARSIFVGNLPYKADESSLQQYILEQCQFQPEGVRIVRDKDTKQCKGFAYILFAEKSLARQALDVLSKNSQPYLKRVLRFQVCGRRFKKSTTTSSKRTFEGKRAASEKTGAAKRISTKKRARGNNTKKSAAPHKKSSKSKRAAAHAKEEKRVKQLQKRLSKGMGKARK